jgi:hypothetical protein
VIAVLYQGYLYIVRTQCRLEPQADRPRHVIIGLAVEQAHGAGEVDRRVKPQVAFGIGEEAGIGRGRLGAIGVGLIEHLARRQLRALGLAIAPAGEIGRGGNADQAREPVLQMLGDQQHQPSAHRRSRQHHRP